MPKSSSSRSGKASAPRKYKRVADLRRAKFLWTLLAHCPEEEKQAIRDELLDIARANAGLRSSPDRRTKADKERTRQGHWANQIDAMVQAYKDWIGDGRKDINLLEISSSASTLSPVASEEPIGGTEVEIREMKIVDISDTQLYSFPSPEGGVTSAKVIRAGSFPASPLYITVVFTTRLLHLFHTHCTTCHGGAVATFLKALCRRQKVEYKSHLAEQFKVTYETYLEVLHRVPVDEMANEETLESDVHKACPICE